MIELVGPRGTAQGAEAETKLQELLGSTRSSGRGNDVGSHGALGLLWVAQSEGLKIASPSQGVRDTIAASLETEVGSILGGEAYRKVRTRVDQQRHAVAVRRKPLFQPPMMRLTALLEVFMNVLPLPTGSWYM